MWINPVQPSYRDVLDESANDKLMDLYSTDPGTA